MGTTSAWIPAHKGREDHSHTNTCSILTREEDTCKEQEYLASQSTVQFDDRQLVGHAPRSVMFGCIISSWRTWHLSSPVHHFQSVASFPLCTHPWRFKQQTLQESPRSQYNPEESPLIPFTELLVCCSHLESPLMTKKPISHSRLINT